jgi:hypothetical protein
LEIVKKIIPPPLLFAVSLERIKFRILTLTGKPRNVDILSKSQTCEPQSVKINLRLNKELIISYLNNGN